MDRRSYLRAVGGAATLATAGLAGCFGIGARGRPEFDVGMSTDAFDPRTVETTVGEPVVWLNTSSHAHTVTAYEDGLPDGVDYFASGGFDSEGAARDAWATEEGGALYRGDSYEYAFDEPGEYAYFCVPHEGPPARMVGTVAVSEE